MPGGGSVTYLNSGIANFNHPDWQGNVRLSTNVASRTFSSSTEYAPFGESYDQGTGSNCCWFAFNGGSQMDMVSGMYDTPNRELHPTQGRWIQPDPAGLAAVDPSNPQTWNRYAYVNNNPLSAVDPSGLRMEPDCRIMEMVGCGGGGGAGDSGVYVDGVGMPAFSSLGTDLVDFGGGIDVSIAIVSTTIASTWVDTGRNGTGCTADFCAGTTETTTYLGAATFTDYLPSFSSSSMPSNLPGGTPEKFWGPFVQGLKAALAALKRNKCGSFFGGQGPATMSDTTYRFLDLGNANIGAETVSPSSVFINSAGPYMTYSPVAGQRGPFGLYWSQSEFRGFILLHELGHQLSSVTGFQPDAGSPLNEAQSQQVIGACR